MDIERLVRVKRLHENAKLPTKANPTDAGYDLYSVEKVVIRPGETAKVHTGIAIEQGHDWQTYPVAGLIWDRSSLGSKGIHRLAGVIDQGYRGEIVVCLINLRIGEIIDELISESGRTGFPQDELHEVMGRSTVTIQPGDKIAQIVFHHVNNLDVVEVPELGDTDRGAKGFGSSGR